MYSDLQLGPELARLKAEERRRQEREAQRVAEARRDRQLQGRPRFNAALRLVQRLALFLFTRA